MLSQSVPSIFSLFSTALWDLANSRPVYSLMLSSRDNIQTTPGLNKANKQKKILKNFDNSGFSAQMSLISASAVPNGGD